MGRAKREEGTRRRRASLLLPIASGLLAFSALLPIDEPIHRWGLGAVLGVMTLIGAWAQWSVGRVAKANRAELVEKTALIESVSSAADVILEALARACCTRGDWRVSVFAETVASDGSIAFRRVHRLALNPALADGGVLEFSKQLSLLRGPPLELGDPNAPPVDQRYNFADPDKDARVTWIAEQKVFVGERAESMRMGSRSYVWRRVLVPGRSHGPHVLMVESTHPEGVNKAGLLHPSTDALVSASVVSLGPILPKGEASTSQAGRRQSSKVLTVGRLQQ